MKKEQTNITPPQTNNLINHERIKGIDGMRGIASILVVFCHLACAFLPSLYFIENASSTFSQIWLKSPLQILTNGSLSVIFFFFISGYLITKKIYTNKTSFNPIKHYGKFAKIVIPSTIFAFLLCICGLMFNLKALELNSNLNFLNSYYNFTPSFKSLLSNSIYKTYIESNVYVGPLWTIRNEFFGSIFITALSMLCSNNRKFSKLIYILVSLLFIFSFWQPYLAVFTFGAYVADCIHTKDTDSSILGKISKFCQNKIWARIVILILGVYLACTNLSVTGFWYPLSFIPIDSVIFRGLGIALVMVVIIPSSKANKILSIKPLQWLGKMSAWTYVFHWPIICSVGCGLYLLFHGVMDYYLAIAIISVVCIAVTLLFSWGYDELNKISSKHIKIVIGKLKDKIKNKKKTTDENN